MLLLTFLATMEHPPPPPAAQCGFPPWPAPPPGQPPSAALKPRKNEQRNQGKQFSILILLWFDSECALYLTSEDELWRKGWSLCRLVAWSGLRARCAFIFASLPEGKKRGTKSTLALDFVARE